MQNAASLEGEGYRTIAYDPNWAAGDTPGFYLVLGHEVGHLFCGHNAGDLRGDRSKMELEADQFGGASIKRFEVYHGKSFFSQVLSAAMTKYPDRASSMYPPRVSRLEALRRGYEQGSQCGGLSPVEEAGFSQEQRAKGLGPCLPVQTGPTSYTCRH